MLRAVLIALSMATAVAAEPGATSMLNAFRAELGRPALSRSEALDAAAQGHARDMAENGFFSHTGSTSGSLGDRVRAQGYGFCFVAENIAQGQTSLTDVVQSWADSRGHRRNMADRRATEFGIARAPGNIWVLVLARPGC